MANSGSFQSLLCDQFSGAHAISSTDAFRITRSLASVSRKRTRSGGNDMPYYRVTLRGEKFPLRENGKWKLFGFVTTRDIDAETPEDAERHAVRLIFHDDTWAHVNPYPGFPVPRIIPIDLEVIEDISFDDDEYEFFRMRK